MPGEQQQHLADILAQLLLRILGQMLERGGSREIAVLQHGVVSQAFARELAAALQVGPVSGEVVQQVLRLGEVVPEGGVGVAGRGL